MSEPNIEDMLKGLMGEMSGVKDVKTTPTTHKVEDNFLYESAKRHLQGLIEQQELTAGQIALLGPLVSLVSMNSRW